MQSTLLRGTLSMHSLRRQSVLTGRCSLALSRGPRAACLLSTQAQFDWTKIRNVGILAHIDAGKTTTTENLLYLCGRTKSIGRVDNGDTVMDFLPQEKERGITISAAAISAHWKQHQINIIDTPGHVDFTMEVEVSTRVLDGCVLVVDALAGVQCQTKTVWRKIAGRALPAVVFVNKMDRVGADFSKAVESIARELNANPLPLHWPLISADGEFEGYVDLLSRLMFQWPVESNVKSAGTNKNNRVDPIVEPVTEQHALREEVDAQRSLLFDALSAADDEFLEMCLEKEYDQISPADALPALRRATLARHVLPTFCGAALRGKGVNALLDGIVAFLPSPAELPPVLLMKDQTQISSSLATHTNDVDDAPNSEDSSGLSKDFERGGIFMRNAGDALSLEQQEAKKRLGNKTLSEKKDVLCALVFKVVHDNMRGLIAYTRVFSGSLRAKDSVYNATTKKSERVQQVLVPSGEELSALSTQALNNSSSEDVARAGGVVCLLGLKHVRSGDALLCDSERAELRNYILPGMSIPPPVFALAVEPASASQQTQLENALKILCIEDPSLVVEQNIESGQTLLRGLGELHLEIAIDKLRRQHKLEVYTGKAYVGYRETISQDIPLFESNYERIVDGKRIAGQCSLLISTVNPAFKLEAQRQQNKKSKKLDAIVEEESDDARFAREPSYEIDEEVKRSLSAEEFTALNDALRNAVSRGPRGYPVVGLHVQVQAVGRDACTTPGALRACVSTAVAQALSNENNRVLLEPLMTLEVEAPDEYVGSVVSDLSAKRRAVDVEIRSLGANSLVQATVPLQCALGYATALRSMTHGEAAFTAEYRTHAPVSECDAVL